jgi:hypothetical protein
LHPCCDRAKCRVRILGRPAKYLITTLTNYLREIQRHVITDFDGSSYDRFVAFARIGTGSLAARTRPRVHASCSRAANSMCRSRDQRAPDDRDRVRRLQGFLDDNDLRRLALEPDGLSDAEILDEFRKGNSEPVRSS